LNCKRHGQRRLITQETINTHVSDSITASNTPSPLWHRPIRFMVAMYSCIVRARTWRLTSARGATRKFHAVDGLSHHLERIRPHDWWSATTTTSPGFARQSGPPRPRASTGAA